MISRIFRLVDVKRIEMVLREIDIKPNTILVKPEYMSICAADQRYFLGKRSKEVLQQKLPMALIHEATATVLYDYNKKLERGTKVVLIPLIESGSRPYIKGNYDPESIFMSSGHDGFMRDFLAVQQGNIIPVPEDKSKLYVFSEIVSVGINAISAFERVCLDARGTFGVWGDGSVGFIISLLLRCIYPQAKIIVFGKTLRKLQRFSFVDKTMVINEVPVDLRLDHCFECVGGTGSEDALAQIIRHIRPQGCISLLGVSEELVSVDTRSILNKGLTLLGNSRSDASDFKKAVNLIHSNKTMQKYLEMLISETIAVNNENDIPHVFEQDSLNDFKTVIRWEI